MTGRHLMSSSYKIVLRGVALCALLLSFLPVGAQAQEVREVTFNEAVQIALDRNVTILRAQNNLELQELTVQSEKMDFLPNMNLNSGGNRNFGFQFDQTSGRLVNQSTDGFSLSASSSVSLFAGFANVASLAGARATLESQEYSYERTRQTVVFNVVSNYLNVILGE